MFIVNRKDTRTTPLTSLILNIVKIDILNIEQLSHLILVLKLLTLNSRTKGKSRTKFIGIHWKQVHKIAPLNFSFKIYINFTKISLEKEVGQKSKG